MAGIQEGLRFAASLYLDAEKQKRQSLIDDVNFGTKALSALGDSVKGLPEQQQIDIMLDGVNRLQSTVNNKYLSPIYDSAITSLKARKTMFEFAVSEDKKLSNLVDSLNNSTYTSRDLKSIETGIKSIIGDFASKGQKIDKAMSAEINNVLASIDYVKGVSSYIDNIDTNKNTPQIEFSNNPNDVNYVDPSIRPKVRNMKQLLMAGMPVSEIQKKFGSVFPSNVSTSNTSAGNGGIGKQTLEQKKVAQNLTTIFNELDSIKSGSAVEDTELKNITVATTATDFTEQRIGILDNVSKIVSKEFELFDSPLKEASKKYIKAKKSGNPSAINRAMVALEIAFKSNDATSDIIKQVGGSDVDLLLGYRNAINQIDRVQPINVPINFTPPSPSSNGNNSSKKSKKTNNNIRTAPISSFSNDPFSYLNLYGTALGKDIKDIAVASTSVGNYAIDITKNVKDRLQSLSSNVRKDNLEKMLENKIKGKYGKAKQLKDGDIIKLFGKTYRYIGGDKYDINNWKLIK